MLALAPNRAMDALAIRAYGCSMNGVTLKPISKNLVSRLWSFIVRRQAKRDQEFCDVLSSPDGREDVETAKLASVGQGQSFRRG